MICIYFGDNYNEPVSPSSGLSSTCYELFLFILVFITLKLFERFVAVVSQIRITLIVITRRDIVLHQIRPVTIYSNFATLVHRYHARCIIL